MRGSPRISRKLTVSTLLEAGSSLMLLSWIGDGMSILVLGDVDSTSFDKASPGFATGWALRGVLLGGGLMERLDGRSTGEQDGSPSFVFRRFRGVSSAILPSQNNFSCVLRLHLDSMGTRQFDKPRQLLRHSVPRQRVSWHGLIWEAFRIP